MAIYALGTASTHCAQPWRNGWAEWTWVVLHTEIIYA